MRRELMCDVCRDAAAVRLGTDPGEWSGQVGPTASAEHHAGAAHRVVRRLLSAGVGAGRPGGHPGRWGECHAGRHRQGQRCNCTSTSRWSSSTGTGSTSAMHGNFGTSLATGQSVSQQIVQRFPVTFGLVMASAMVALIIGIPLGIISGVRPGGTVDGGARTFSTLGLAMPSFWLAVILVSIFAVHWKIFPPTGYTAIIGVVHGLVEGHHPAGGDPGSAGGRHPGPTTAGLADRRPRYALCPNGLGQGWDAPFGAIAPRPQERLDAGGDGVRCPARLPARGGGHRRADLRHPRPRDLHAQWYHRPRPAGGPRGGDGLRSLPDGHEPSRRHQLRVPQPQGHGSREPDRATATDPGARPAARCASGGATTGACRRFLTRTRRRCLSFAWLLLIIVFGDLRPLDRPARPERPGPAPHQCEA